MGTLYWEHSISTSSTYQARSGISNDPSHWPVRADRDTGFTWYPGSLLSSSWHGKMQYAPSPSSLLHLVLTSHLLQSGSGSSGMRARNWPRPSVILGEHSRSSTSSAPPSENSPMRTPILALRKCA